MVALFKRKQLWLLGAPFLWLDPVGYLWSEQPYHAKGQIGSQCRCGQLQVEERFQVHEEFENFTKEETVR